MNEQALLWVLGSINGVSMLVLGLLFRVFREHERECRERWEKFRDEHGSLAARMSSAASEIERMRDAQHDLRDDLPNMIERTVRMLR